MCITTWVNPENMLSERSPTQKDHLLYESIYMEFLGQTSPKTRLMIVEGWWGSREWEMGIESLLMGK